ncbi:6-phosphofructokinase [candidate division KSB1 bacterium]|nr:6-phosphofructokinase [candidate division KSB1 bacterium]
MRLAILTSGGDCPGLNAVIRAVVRAANDRHQWEVVGIKNGWKGAATGELVPLPAKAVSGILYRGGTILGTSRFNPMQDKQTTARILENLTLHQIDAVICVGGDGTLRASHELAKLGVNIIGVPKTIDNDIAATDVTFGFHTAVQIVTDAIDRLHSTAESHARIMILETMGRHTGWIALMAGMAGGADLILIPERPFSYETICDQLAKRHERKSFSIVVIAEGAHPAGGKPVDLGELDAFGRPRLGGIGFELAHEIETRTQIESRVTVLSYVQRGGSPVAYDRILATRFGVAAVAAVKARQYDHFIALKGEHLVPIPIADGIGQPKTADDELFSVAELFFG